MHFIAVVVVVHQAAVPQGGAVASPACPLAASRLVAFLEEAYQDAEVEGA